MSQGKEIQLSDHFSFGRLLRFTAPTITMMVFLSIYGVVDGLMVSNFVGKTPFAALNIIWPYVAILSAFGFMFSTGGSALVAKLLGEQKKAKAQSVFTMLLIAAAATGFILGIFGLLTMRKMAILMGAEGELVELCCIYARILMLTLPVYLLQIFFQAFMVTAERPKLGLWITVAAGITNMVLDVVFIGVFRWGLVGAALATALGEAVGAFGPLIYFLTQEHNTNAPLRLVKPSIDLSSLWQTASNGLSELVMNLSLSLVSMLYTRQLLTKVGENGVIAYGEIMYFAFAFMAVFIGFGMGSAPAISYHFGAGNKQELHSLVTKSIVIVTSCGILISLLAQIMASPLSKILVGYDDELFNYATRAFRIYALCYLFCGLNCAASAFFTALNNGPVSALISLLRTIALEAGCVIVIPMLFGIEAIWCSVTVAEVITTIVSIFLFFKLKPKYGY